MVKRTAGNPRIVKIVAVTWFDERHYAVTLSDESVHHIVSVTTHLGVATKWPLIHWRGDVGNREADMRLYEGQWRGRRVHHACELIVQNGLVIYNPLSITPIYKPKDLERYHKSYGDALFTLLNQEEHVMVWRFRRWLDIVNPLIKEVERPVASIKLGSAGTIDFIAEIKRGWYPDINGKEAIFLEGGEYVIDLKTTSMKDDDHEVQVAQYHEILTDLEPKRKLAGCLVVYVNAHNTTGIEGLQTSVVLGSQIKHLARVYQGFKTLWEYRNPNVTPDVFEFPSALTWKWDRKKKPLQAKPTNGTQSKAAKRSARKAGKKGAHK